MRSGPWPQGPMTFLGKPVEIDELKIMLKRASYLAGIEHEHNQMMNARGPDFGTSLNKPSDVGSLRDGPEGGGFR